MAKLIPTKEILTVSYGSFVFCSVGSLILMLGVIFTKVKGGQLISLMLGSEASASLLNESQNSIVGPLDSLLSSDILGHSIVFLLWTFVGLLVLVILAGLKSATNEVVEIEQQSKMVHGDIFLARSLGAELLFRTMVAIVWTAYLLVCVQLVLPFFVAAVFVVFGGQAGLADWFVAVLSVVMVFLCLHLHVILARLFFGRVRLFNSKL